MPLPGKNVKKGGVPTLANLDQVLPWPAIRQALQIAETSSELPEVVICPLCSGALTAYPLDTYLLGSQCASCRWTGDGLDLGPAASGNSTPWPPYKNSKPLVLQSLPVISTPNEPSDTSKLSGHAVCACQEFLSCRRCISAMPNASADARPVKPATWIPSAGSSSLVVFSAVLGETIPFWRHSFTAMAALPRTTTCWYCRLSQCRDAVPVFGWVRCQKQSAGLALGLRAT